MNEAKLTRCLRKHIDMCSTKSKKQHHCCYYYNSVNLLKYEEQQPGVDHLLNCLGMETSFLEVVVV